jgi:hypothetical protein
MITLIEPRSEYASLEEKYFVVVDHTSSKADFVRAARVRDGSYAHGLMERVYDCIVTHAVDIREEYETYYAEEYSDIETFLYWKHSVDRSITAQVTESLNPRDFWGYGSLYWGGEYNLGQFIASDVGLELVNDIFRRMREAAGESAS